MDKVKRLLVEFYETPTPKRFERYYDYTLLETNKILSFVGVRRSGKTSYLYQIIHHLQEKGVKKENLIYLNFEDDRLYPLEGNELDSILPSIKEVLDIDHTQNIYLFLDEIQNIENWSRWLRRVHDTQENITLFVTGSSSKLLSREIGTELRGRTLSTEVFPFSFKEYLVFNEISYDKKKLDFSTNKGEILKHFNSYLNCGGFPEILYNPQNKKEILQEYFSAIFYKDLVERHNIKSTKMFEDFLKLLVQSVGNVSSLTNLENNLKSLGHKVSKSTLGEYLEYAQEAYFLFTLPVFSPKIKNQLIYPKKIYGIDNGLLNSITFKLIEQQSILLENIVFLELRKQKKELFYYKTKNDLEVDFLVKEDVEFKELIQVSVSIKDEQTRKREVRALEKAIEELGLKTGTIITLDEKEVIEINGKKINVVPIWEFLL